jgi:hypothetical protein
MGFAVDPAVVRVDFFRELGKWYTTEAVLWPLYHDCEVEGGRVILLHDVFLTALSRHLWDVKHHRVRLNGMWAVRLEPYHEHSHPLMAKVPDQPYDFAVVNKRKE